MMARGEPGLPHQFRWRKTNWEVAEILESRKEHGDCTHGSGERYVRKHVYRVRTTDGTVLAPSFPAHLRPRPIPDRIPLVGPQHDGCLNLRPKTGFRRRGGLGMLSFPLPP